MSLPKVPARVRVAEEEEMVYTLMTGETTLLVTTPTTISCPVVLCTAIPDKNKYTKNERVDGNDFYHVLH
jgi:hypothetical protein